MKPLTQKGINIAFVLLLIFTVKMYLNQIETELDYREYLWTKESVPPGRFNEFLVDRYRKKDAFTQKIKLSDIESSEEQPYIAHYFYAIDNSVAIQFKISFETNSLRNATLVFNYLVQNEAGGWVSELTDKKYLELNRDDISMRIDLSDGQAAYYLNDKLTFNIPILHEVVRMGTKYSGATFELKTQNPE